MRNVKTTLLITLLLLVVVGSADAAKTNRMTANQSRAKALDLLDKSTKKRNRFPALIVEYEITSKWSNHTRYKKFECRVDKNRGSLRWYMWGYVSNLYPNVSKDRPQYYSKLWDGQNYYSYGCVPPGPGNVSTIRKKDISKKWEGLERVVGWPVALMMGYKPGDNKRIHERLGRAQHIRLRKKKEKIGTANCYVIDAVVRGHGKYKLWIDPVHDYHIAKIHVRKEEGDYKSAYGGKKLPKNSYIDKTYEVLSWQQIGGSWFPSRYKQKGRNFGERGLGKTNRIVSITNIILNPDHDALKSFVPDDIPNGAYVTIIDFPIEPHNIWRNGEFVTNAHFIWQDGKFMDEKGQEVDLDKLIENSKKAKKRK